MRKRLFWLPAMLTAASFVFGLIKHPTFHFIASWGCGVVGAIATFVFLLSNYSDKDERK